MADLHTQDCWLTHCSVVLPECWSTRLGQILALGNLGGNHTAQKVLLERVGTLQAIHEGSKKYIKWVVYVWCHLHDPRSGE